MKKTTFLSTRKKVFSWKSSWTTAYAAQPPAASLASLPCCHTWRQTLWLGACPFQLSHSPFSHFQQIPLTSCSQQTHPTYWQESEAIPDFPQAQVDQTLADDVPQVFLWGGMVNSHSPLLSWVYFPVQEGYLVLNFLLPIMRYLLCHDWQTAISSSGCYQAFRILVWLPLVCFSI